MANNSIYQWCPDGPTDIAWETVQKSYHCCGVNGYKDWSGNSNYKYWRTGQAVLELHYENSQLREHPIPDSCCNLNEDTDPKERNMCGLKKDTDPYEHGCLAKIEQNLEENLVRIAG